MRLSVLSALRDDVPQHPLNRVFNLFLLRRPPPTSTLFPYTTLFRSSRQKSRAPRRGPLARPRCPPARVACGASDRKSTRLNSSHVAISYAVFCLKKKNTRRTSFLRLMVDLIITRTASWLPTCDIAPS